MLLRVVRIVVLLLIIAGVPIGIAYGQTLDSVRLRIMSYNMDDFGKTTAARYSDLEYVVKDVKPNVMIAQGVVDSIGASLQWAIFPGSVNVQQSPYDGQNRSVLMYDSTVVKLIYHNVIPTAFRSIDEFIMYVPATSDSFIVASCEFVFGDDPASIEQRALQAQALRYHLHQRRIQNIVVVGTLNFHSNVENGYRWLTEDSPFGDSILRNPMYDPVDSQGVWHRNPNFARLHTYCTRLDTALDTSGVVDRYDYMILTQDLRFNSYVNSSHRITGNFGKVFGKSITGNGTIGTLIQSHLERASRHLPVQIDLMFRRKSTEVKRNQTSPKEMDLSSVDWYSVNEALIVQPSGGSTPKIFPLTGQQSLATP